MNQHNQPKRKALILRYESTEQGTFGALLLDGKFFCYTGELPWRNNQANVSCIPAGTYVCKIKQSPTFGTVYELQNVEDRTYIYIHAGNHCGDVSRGFKSNSKGCILTGSNVQGFEGQRAVVASRFMFSKLMKELAGESFLLTIKDCYD